MGARDKTKLLGCLLALALAAAWAVPAAPAGVIGKEDRRTFATYRKQEGLSADEFARRFGAAARIQCRWGRLTVWGSAAIVDRPNVFVTADHIFFNRKFRKYGAETACFVETLADRQRYRIKPGSVVHGYVVHGRSGPRFGNDWAAGKLAGPARVDHPFALEDTDRSLPAGRGLTLITQGHDGWGDHRPSAGNCAVIKDDGVLVATDCDAARGASGGPLLVAGPAGDDSPRIAAIVVAVADLDKSERQRYADLSHIAVGVMLRGQLARAVRGLRPPLPRPKPVAIAALGAWTQQLAADPGDGQGRLGRAMANLQLGRIEPALDDLDAAVRTATALPPQPVQDVLALLDETIADFAAHPAVMLLRASLFHRLGDSARREREYARYVRWRQDAVPPLGGRQWAGLEALWGEARFADYKALAVSFGGERIYRGSGYGWARTAAADVMASCTKYHGQGCRLYALGDRVVWGLDYAKTERALDQYEAQRRARLGHAVAALTRGIAAGDTEALLARGDRHLDLGQLAAALGDYDSSVRQRPHSGSGWLKRARVLFRLEQYDRAAADFSEAGRRDPDALGEEAALWGARAGIRLGRVEPARTAFQRLMDGGRPQNRDAARLGRGLARLFAGDGAAALNDFAAVAARHRADADYQDTICRHLLLVGLPAAALVYCEAANRLVAGDPRYLDSRAFAYWQLDRRKEAEWDLVKAALIDRQASGPLLRQARFGVLLAKFFLWRQGYDVGAIDSIYDEPTRVAIATYQRRRGMAISGRPDDELLADLSLLGLGSQRIEQVGLALPAFRIKAACMRAVTGAKVDIADTEGVHYRCNADGASVRRLPRLAR